MFIDNLLNVSSTLATRPPPPELYKPGPLYPTPAPTNTTGCSSCPKSIERYDRYERYEDLPTDLPTVTTAPTAAPWVSPADDLLFADDELQKGEGTVGAPYSSPGMSPGGTMFSNVNAIGSAAAMQNITAPGQFQQAVGAQGLGSGTTTSFTPPQATEMVPAVASTTNTGTKWMPKGLSNTQALVLAVVVCTALFLLLFIVGMGTAAAPAPETQFDPMMSGL